MKNIMDRANSATYDFIVVGSGLAGLSFALKAAKLGRVLVISKDELIQTNTWRAQGGVASVTSKSDSFENHVQDTLTAGDGLCHKPSVIQIIEQGPSLIDQLIELGVHFDSTNNVIDLGKEGGHSERRILHIDDVTGQAVHSVMIENAKKNSNIELIEHVQVSELLLENGMCVGLKAYDDKHLYDFYAPHTLLATGGTGKVFLYTSNWSGATGDGMALAYKAGAQLSNLEFTQFHPTCLFHPVARNFLISEALRGEGARLLNSKGEAFMIKYHKLADLAPRDIVARAIDQEMKSLGSECVWLDLSYLKNPELKNRFPKIYSRCLELGIDFLKQPIPVVPAAHYMCGGITVNHSSETSIPNLYALGECADTGLHGANRLASNSLLECLATAENAFAKISKTISSDAIATRSSVIKNKQSVDLDPEATFQITILWDEIRSTMWHRMGIVRTNQLMKGALHKLNFFYDEIEALKVRQPQVTEFQSFTELENLCLVAKLMITSAMGRKESRGCHFNSNYPERLKLIQKSTCSLGFNVEYLEIDR
jgi:L-aspartate oxidase